MATLNVSCKQVLVDFIIELSGFDSVRSLVFFERLSGLLLRLDEYNI